MNPNNASGKHSPAPDFATYLATDLQRRLRHEARFGRRSAFAGPQFVKLAAIAATIVLTLSVGLVWGVGTGFAAAQIQDGTKRAEPIALAMMRTTPVRRALSALSCNAPAAAATQRAQQGPPVIIDLPDAPAKATSTLGFVGGVRELPAGKVLVNDGTRRQMKIFDSTLAAPAIVMDSAAGSANSYGPRPAPLVRYLGDSSLSSDVNAGTLLMIDGRGLVTRALASPFAQTEAPFLNLTTMMRDRYTYVDNKGRILFQGPADPVRPGMSVEERVARQSKQFNPLLRADLETRHVDTVTMLKRGGSTALMGRANNEGPVRITSMPVEIVDVFGVLSDGTIGVVRGQDYHVDWFLPDGTTRSTPKLPFDWKPLTIEDKQRMIDSAKAQAATRTMQIRNPDDPDAGGPPGGRGGGGAGAPPGRTVPVQYVPPALDQLPDFHPSIRMSSAIADLDGNLWILPNSSAQSRNGELVYDVVNPGGDFHRVRVPLGRSIVGFGKGGVVFLQSGDRASGFTLERTRLPGSRTTPKR